MSNYFDKDFWRFLLGFIAIISTSLIILIASRLYEQDLMVEENRQTGSVINLLKNNN